MKGGECVLDRILRGTITVVAGLSGLLLMNTLIPLFSALVGAEFFRIGVFGVTMTTILSFLFGMLFFGALGFFASPYLVRQVHRLTDLSAAMLLRVPTNEILLGALGGVIGLIVANLLGAAFSPLPIVGKYLPGFLSIVLGLVGINVAIRKKEDFATFWAALPRLGREKDKEKHKSRVEPDCTYKILDTSVIIDGRIADISTTGFLEGTLVVPRFVLEELQHIADSSDSLKRNRGRRGLDILNAMQKKKDVAIMIVDDDFDDLTEVDAKLVRLGQQMGAKVVTNDFNLNKVAELQGVFVLNINELANAIKPVVLPGEEMTVTLVKEGKELGQGVGYLDDGTMIVVEGGRKFMGETLSVLVTSVLQTAAGRVIFARMRS